MKQYKSNSISPVEHKISSCKAESLKIVFDFHKTPESNYFTVFPRYISAPTIGYSSVCHGVSPLENERKQVTN